MIEDVTVAYSKHAELRCEAEAYIVSIKSGMKQLLLDHFESLPHCYQLFYQLKESNKMKKREKDWEINNNFKHFKSNDTYYVAFSGASLAKANLLKSHDGKVLCKEYAICHRNCSQRSNCH